MAARLLQINCAFCGAETTQRETQRRTHIIDDDDRDRFCWECRLSGAYLVTWAMRVNVSGPLPTLGDYDRMEFEDV